MFGHYVSLHLLYACGLRSKLSFISDLMFDVLSIESNELLNLNLNICLLLFLNRHTTSITIIKKAPPELTWSKTKVNYIRTNHQMWRDEKLKNWKKNSDLMRKHLELIDVIKGRHTWNYNWDNQYKSILWISNVYIYCTHSVLCYRDIGTWTRYRHTVTPRHTVIHKQRGTPTQIERAWSVDKKMIR